MIYSFDINSVSDIYKLGDFVHNTKLDSNDHLSLNVPSADPFEYSERIAYLFSMSFYPFINACRTGANQNPVKTFIYSDSYKADNSDPGKYMGELLSLNTNLNISIKHKPNTHEITLPVFTSTDFSKEYHQIEMYFIKHPVMPGDKMILNVSETNLDTITQCLYYAIIGAVLNLVGEMFKIPPFKHDFADNYFDACDAEKSLVPARLAKSGVEFSIVCKAKL
jgi:hypothetical protein